MDLIPDLQGIFMTKGHHNCCIRPMGSNRVLISSDDKSMLKDLKEPKDTSSDYDKTDSIADPGYDEKGMVALNAPYDKAISPETSLSENNSRRCNVAIAGQFYRGEALLLNLD
ncbi:hypothetical protein Ancab_001850 [Ancistrocladus abbreviatus]